MESEEAIVALEALAQGSRLGIFRLLVSAGSVGLPAGRIAEEMKLPNATLSFHLAQLKNARLIKCDRQSRSLIYSAPSRADRVLATCCTKMSSRVVWSGLTETRTAPAAARSVMKASGSTWASVTSWRASRTLVGVW